MAEPESHDPKRVVPLADAIAALRSELWKAFQDGQDDRLKFKPAPIELTLQAAVTTEGKASGGIKWWLINATGELSRQSVATQTVKLTLEPVMFDQSGHPLDEIFIEAGE